MNYAWAHYLWCQKLLDGSLDLLEFNMLYDLLRQTVHNVSLICGWTRRMSGFHKCQWSSLVAEMDKKPRVPNESELGSQDCSSIYSSMAWENCGMVTGCIYGYSLSVYNLNIFMAVPFELCYLHEGCAWHINWSMLDFDPLTWHPSNGILRGAIPVLLTCQGDRSDFYTFISGVLHFNRMQIGSAELHGCFDCRHHRLMSSLPFGLFCPLRESFESKKCGTYCFYIGLQQGGLELVTCQFVGHVLLIRLHQSALTENISKPMTTVLGVCCAVRGKSTGSKIDSEWITKKHCIKSTDRCSSLLEFLMAECCHDALPSPSPHSPWEGWFIYVSSEGATVWDGLRSIWVLPTHFVMDIWGILWGTAILQYSPSFVVKLDGKTPFRKHHAISLNVIIICKGVWL